MARRTVVTVAPISKNHAAYKRGYRWHVKYTNSSRMRFALPYPLKSDAIFAAKEEADWRQPSQLIVKGKDGRVQYEHTYPRSSDPKRHKG